MIRDFSQDCAVLQNGFWRAEIDLARPRVVSLRADPNGLIRYCQEMLEPGFGGESRLETASFELYSRAVGLGGESAWEMLSGIIAQWQTNHLSCTPFLDWCRSHPGKVPSVRLTYTGGNAWTWIDGQGATGAGTEPYLSDGAAIVWAIYAGMLGIRADFQAISFVPHVPQALADTEVAVRLMGRRLIVRYRGHGDSLGALTHNGQGVAGNRVDWRNLNEGDVVDAEVRQ